MNSRKNHLRHWEGLFHRAGVDTPRLSAQVLLAHVLNVPRLDMLLDSAAMVSELDTGKMEELGLRRLDGEPVAYLIGEKEFYGYEFEVCPAVLIPRPETELVLDFLQEAQSPSARKTVVDLGTGSGVLAVTCARLFTAVEVLACDISFEALRVAKRNAVRHGVNDRIIFLQSDLMEAVNIGEVDIILANLPYVPTSTKSSISREVLGFEPKGALFAGVDGLDCYRRLFRMLAGNMRSGTQLLCEIDHTQGGAMKEMFAPIAEEVRIVKDLAGHDRLAFVVF
jgi:release factor glutamine methyltransferase